jgi:hypothetical protein
MELQLFLENVVKNSFSSNFIIICRRFVRRNQKKIHFCGLGSFIKKMAPTPPGS